MNQKEEKRQEAPTDKDEGRISPKARACFWLACAVTVFVCAVIMCLTLIGKSADSASPLVTTDKNVPDIRYELDGTTPVSPNEPPEDDTAVLTSPVSVNSSSILNILLIGYDETSAQTDTLMILSVDLKNATAGMLSIPRDTYVSGGFTQDKINRVYSDRGARGLASLKELIESMIGFKLDYYVLFDADSMAEILELTGPLTFDVPSEPAYHRLKSGTQQISASDAFALFCFKESYSDVETDPYFVQRDYLAAILDTLLSDQSTLAADCEAICTALETDLSPENLAYLANLLKNFRFSTSFSRALPGDEVTVDGVDYYQVDAEKAVELLNENLNPLSTDLTKYDVNFRQKQAGSGEGETSPWGFGDSTEDETQEPTEEPTEDETPSESDSEPEPTETEESSSTEAPSETQEPTETDAPTEPPTETDPPEPSGGDDE